MVARTDSLDPLVACRRPPHGSSRTVASRIVRACRQLIAQSTRPCVYRILPTLVRSLNLVVGPPAEPLGEVVGGLTSEKNLDNVERDSAHSIPNPPQSRRAAITALAVATRQAIPSKQIIAV